MNSKNLPLAGCVFIVREGKVLSVSRKHDDGSFGLPGGKAEEGESARVAAVRECLEETGCVAGGLRLLYEEACSGYWCSTFLAVQFYGEPRDMGQGRVCWILPDQLLTGEFSEYNRHVLKAYRKLMYDV